MIASSYIYAYRTQNKVFPMHLKYDLHNVYVKLITWTDSINLQVKQNAIEFKIFEQNWQWKLLGEGET